MLKNYFLPSKTDSVYLNEKIYKKLIESLSELAQADNSIEYKINDIIDQLCKKKASSLTIAPLCYAFYYRLGFCLLNNDINDAHFIINEFFDFVSKSIFHKNLIVEAWCELTPHKNIYLASLGEHSGYLLRDVSGKDFSLYNAALLNEIKRVKDYYPSFYEEISCLLKQVIIVNSDTRSKPFLGMSPIQLWRSIFVNISMCSSKISILETLIHEASHTYLFAQSYLTPLTKNNKDELYYSPLRNCERPIEGIYHAMFVSARVAYCLFQMYNAGAFYGSEETAAQDAIKRNIRQFFACESVVMKHAALSCLGKRVLRHTSEAVDIIV